MVKAKREGFELDHDDRNGLNNQSSNLQHLTHSANIKNSAAGDRAFANRGRRAQMALATRQMIEESGHVHKVKARGRTYYYHRQTRVRLPDDPTSEEFKTALVRLNREHELENI